MAGRKQHHIPRMVLRSFMIPSGGRAEKVQVYSQDKTYQASIDDVAAERHFYSELSADGTKTLDDLITDYEGSFATKFFLLRDLPVGSMADSATAAEIVAHLTIRNAYVRRAFGGAFHSLMDRAFDLFCNEENLRQFLGVDARELPEHIKKYVDEEIVRDPRFQATGLPQPVLHKIAFMAMKENFNRLLTENLPHMAVALLYAASEAPQHMRRGHNAALAKGMAPDGRTERLRVLEWSIVASPPAGVILPDCVALGIEREGLPQPLIVADLENVGCALFPLTPEKVLVGKRVGAAAPDLADFNTHAALCSHSFFVSHRTGSDLQALMARIGQRTEESLEETVGSAFKAFMDERSLDASAPEHETPIDEQETPQRDATAEPALTNYVISFKGIADEQTAHRIAAILKDVVIELQRLMSLDRLDGFTFAADYDAALSELDRGFQPAEPLRAGKPSYGVSVARTPLVMRESKAKGHVVARIEIAEGLISEDEETQRQTFHVIVQQLAHVAYMQLLDEALPDAYSKPLEDSYEAFLFPHVDTGWSLYFGARAAAVFDPSFGESYRELVFSAIREAQKEIPAARLAYRFDGDLDRLLAVGFSQAGAILGFTGQLLGHCDGLGQDAFDNEELDKLFESAGLRAWVDLFREDLARVWDRRGRWTSLEEFLLLNRHAERVLWQFGLFPWKTSDGQIRVEVPLVADAAHLTGIRPALRGFVWRIRKWGQAIGRKLFGTANSPG